VQGFLARSLKPFAFEDGEDERTKCWLRLRGWRDGEPFVGLLVRDSAYLATDPLHAAAARAHAGRHDHRDSDIATYAETAQRLAGLGYWVVRMGKIVDRPLPATHPRIIDYPFATNQDDLYDIWLAAHCRFFISTGTGIDTVAIAYHRPVVYVNYIPLSHICSYSNSITVPKHLVWKQSGTTLTLKEQLQHGYLGAARYEAADIVIKNLSSAEIGAAVMECEQRLTGRWQESEAARERQKRFWEVLASSPEFHRLHGYIHPESRAGSAWLESMGDAFLE
jgi:putative glycosyltransferase (TIGR04372 family)